MEHPKEYGYLYSEYMDKLIVKTHTRLFVLTKCGVPGPRMPSTAPYKGQSLSCVSEQDSAVATWRMARAHHFLHGH
jgi:hypothetical protein